MDEATSHKIRDLKLKILHVEKELSATQHKAALGQWVQAGHAKEMAKANERERKRLEEKLDELKVKLVALNPETATPESEPVVAEAPAAAAKPKAPKRTAATKVTAAPKTAKKTTKK